MRTAAWFLFLREFAWALIFVALVSWVLYTGFEWLYPPDEIQMPLSQVLARQGEYLRSLPRRMYGD